MLKNQKGITLIALVITIIVLLILAGVSIAMLTGQNGILTQAGNAKTNTTNAQIKEAVSLAVSTINADLADTSTNKYTALNETNIAAAINDSEGTGTATAGSGSITYNVSATESYTVSLSIDTTKGSVTIGTITKN